ncbi:MAG: agmatinase [Deltaproteobacteria bacterium]|nr:agmatinase [Candidatus Anaeroferrophillus wilburensis]MBN2890111.1 agmatinase [Deltaproteobacteria bacterium]
MLVPQGRFLAARAASLEAPPAQVLLGLPFDGTSSYKPGSRFAPAALRDVSHGLETFSYALQRDLDDLEIGDLGDLDLPFGNTTRALAMIRDAAALLMSHETLPLFIGGEHLVTLPIIEAVMERHPDLAVIHFDAHADLRDTYMGEPLSHATVMRRVAEQVGPGNLYQFGIRSGTRDEYAYGLAHTNFYPAALDQVSEVAGKLSGRPVYLSLDLDILDPGCFPGTGTPEPGGVSVAELLQALYSLSALQVVACDVVELSPPADPAAIAAIVAAKVVRELLLLTAHGAAG